MATFDEFYASLDADKNIRGDQFEKKFALWFLRTDPIWSSQIKGVWGWDDYPKRSEWGTDCGVDTAAGMGRVTSDIAWAKLKVMREGAQIAASRLF